MLSCRRKLQTHCRSVFSYTLLPLNIYSFSSKCKANVCVFEGYVTNDFGTVLLATSFLFDFVFWIDMIVKFRTGIATPHGVTSHSDNPAFTVSNRSLGFVLLKERRSGSARLCTTTVGVGSSSSTFSPSFPSISFASEKMTTSSAGNSTPGSNSTDSSRLSL